MKKIIIMTGGLLILPLVSFAQLGDVDTFFNNINEFIGNVLIPLIFGLALLLFLWGMFKFFIAGGHSEDEQAKGKQLILWAVIGFVLMISIWGIVNMISGSVFPDSQPPKLPTSISPTSR